jgi:formylglycine-generating enzyme
LNKKQKSKMTMSAVLIVIVVMGGVSCGKSVRLDKLSIPMTYVKGGTYQMGSTSGDSDEKPVHTVTLDGFYIGRYEVTQDIYEEVMGTNPSNWKGARLPVENVSWYDAVAFANALSRRDGLDEVYTIDGTDVSIDWTKKGYRLPTEAEWEYAARGGKSSQGYTYAGSNTVGDVAWYDDNDMAWYSGKTHEVGGKKSNELGLYDMSGNLWEWVWDWYGDYSESAQTNPHGPLSGTEKVLRGGSAFSDATFVYAAVRVYDIPSRRRDTFGFRILVPAQ